MARPDPAKHGIGARPQVKGAPSRTERGSPFVEPQPAAPPPDDARGAVGRGLRRPSPSPGAPSVAGPPAPAGPGDGRPAPFAAYGPDAAQMAGGVEGAR